MFDFEIDAEFGLALLGIFAVVLIVGIILFVSQQLGIQTYNVLEVGSPCRDIRCDQASFAEEVNRHWNLGIAYCACPNGKIFPARLFS